MKDLNNKSKFAGVRKKAEELLKASPPKNRLKSSEAEMQKLIHELEVHQIELELQNEELIRTKEELEITNKKYIELYDFSPFSYFTLSKEGEIIELNLSAAKMLDRERVNLKNKLFKLFVSEGTKSVFNVFLDRVFKEKTKQSCDLTLLTKENLSLYVHVTGILLEGKEQCFVNILDITERKKAEKEIKSLSRFPSENPNPVLRIDSEGVVVYANPASLEIFNDIKDKSGMVIPEFIKDPLFKAILSNKKIQIEKNIKGKNFMFSIVPISNMDYANVYGLDLTSLKK
jgi:PAS domain-containing protein